MPPSSPSRCERVELRGRLHHVRHWGKPDSPRLFLLHGWLDCSASFQFVADHLAAHWHLVCPDWRGHGESEYSGHCYWFPDYLADLDALLTHFSPDEPARLAGHSMGASLSAMYGALRPARVARLAMLDFIGLAPPEPADPVGQMRAWLDQVAEAPSKRSFPNARGLERRLMQVNPRLTEARAAILAAQLSRPLPEGGLELAWDPWHRVASPYPYRVEDAMQFWKAISCPVLMLEAEKGFVHGRFADNQLEYQRRLACFQDVRVVRLSDCGHNVQHDQPEGVAQALQDFFAEAQAHHPGITL